ncbi:hypothetical protein JCM3765_004352 [Sporobolomyces pararoseus]
MLLPFIPSELVGEIVSHLSPTPYREDEVTEAIVNGKSISLVCRDWRLIGQGLRWKYLCIVPSSFQSLLRHFVAFPHLAPLLQHLHQPRVAEAEEDEEDTSWTEPLALLLSTCQQLRSLDLKGHFGDNFFRIIRSASWLPRLEHFNIFIQDDSTWNADLEKVWSNGFTSLTTFMILADTMGTASQVSPSLLNSAACPSAFMLLGGFSHLVHLQVDMHLDAADETIRSLLEHLPKLLSLEKLRVEVEFEDDVDIQYLDGSEIGMSLERVLASFPSTLLDVQIRQFAFADHTSLRLLEEASPFSEPVLQALYLEHDDMYPMTVWKDVNGQWYREFDAIWSDHGLEEDEDEEEEDDDEEDKAF